jgi:hypothetical protein
MLHITDIIGGGWWINPAAVKAIGLPTPATSTHPGSDPSQAVLWLDSMQIMIPASAIPDVLEAVEAWEKVA